MFHSNLVVILLLSLISGCIYAQNGIKDTLLTLDEFTVIDARTPIIFNTSTLTRSDISVKDLPQSIQAVSRKLIDDQQIYRIEEALKNVAGVNQASAFGSYNFRGFITNSSSFLTNGMRGTLFPEGVSASLANVERIEVLRGPTALLYGENAPAGNINLITKQPSITRTLRANLSLGSFDLLRVQADFTNALNKTKSASGLIGFGYERGGRFTQNFDNQNLVVFSGLHFGLGKRSSLDVNANLNLDRSSSNYAPDLPLFEDQLFATAYDFTTFSDDAKFKGNSILMQARWHYRLSKNWNANLWFGYSRTDAQRRVYSHGWYIDRSTNEVPRSLSLSNMVVPNQTMNAFVSGRVQTGTWEHKLTIGLDANRENASYPGGFSIFEASNLNIVNPDYAFNSLAPLDLTEYFYYSSDEKFTTNTWGGYVQDYITLSSQVKILAGLRFNHYTFTYWADSVSYNNFERYEENPEPTTALIPRVGVVWQPSQSHTFYADYNNGFIPQYANTRQSGGPFPPEISQQFELGWKGDFRQSKLMPTIALYQINKQNVLNADPSDSTGLRQRAIGAVRSRGLEITLGGELSKGWYLQGNYAYNQTKITKSNDVEEIGLRFDNTPEHIAGLWTSYQLKFGLKFGFGLQYVSDRYIQNRRITDQEVIELPAYLKLDVLIQYQRDKFFVNLNVNNVADQRYAAGSYWQASYFPGAPRSIILSVGVKL